MVRRFLRCCIAMAFSCDIAQAHLGLENDTEVRIYADGMKIVVRTSVAFAWTILGERAPMSSDEDGKLIAKPLLSQAAPGLWEVAAGDKKMTPKSSDCVFEPYNDVAFVLNYERPVGWPLLFTARFFPLPGPLETGTIKVFDQTASRFMRGVEPVASKVIDGENPSLSVPMIPAAEASKAMESPAVSHDSPKELPQGSPAPGIPYILLLSALPLVALGLFLAGRKTKS